jgi:hypothetical protein
MIVAPLSGDHTSGQQSDSLLFLLAGHPTSLTPTYPQPSFCTMHSALAMQGKAGRAPDRCVFAVLLSRYGGNSSMATLLAVVGGGQYLLSGPTQTPDTRHGHLMNTNWRATRRQQACLGVAFIFGLMVGPPAPASSRRPHGAQPFRNDIVSKLLTHLLLPLGPLGQVMSR